MLNYIDKINSFDDFYEIMKPLENKQKGDLFEEFTKYIFKYHPNYRHIAKEVWLLNDVPLSILNKLNIPTKDVGIDLIMVDNHAKFYAIQCKFRMNIDEIITWAELSTFYGLSFGIAKGFVGGFIVTNTFELTSLIHTSNKIIPLYGNFFGDITNDFFNELKSILIPKMKFTQMILKPRNYQNDMIRESIMHFRDHDRGQIESACGTGKTLTTYWINKNLFNNVMIVTVPSLFLLSQFYRDWANQMFSENIKAEFLLIGSDADCDDIEYENNGLIITTDIKEIARKIYFVINDKHSNGKRYRQLIIITTYQSSDKLIDALKICKVEPDLLICDEAHKTVGQTDGKFGLLLDDKNIKIRKRLFVTATPKQFNGNVEEFDILSMNDEKWYGKKIHTYNTSDAIIDKWLTDYQIVTMCTDDVYMQNMIDKNKYVWYDKTIIDSRSMATAIMLINQFKKGDCNHLVTYHNSVVGSKKFKELLEKLIEADGVVITVLDIDGKHSMKARMRIIKEFKKSKLSILVSARVLNEGVNIHEIDSICFVDPRISTTDTVQCACRALRLYDGKQMAKIYVPIIVDDMMNIDENKVFCNLIRILKNLSETDNGIKHYFTAVQNGVVCDRQLIRHDNYMSVEKIGENISVDEWMKGIDINVWRKIDSWEYNYNRLKEWVNNNNKIPQYNLSNEMEKNLHHFCNVQKRNKKKGLLDNGKIIKLEKLKQWYWSSDEIRTLKSFDENYDELKKWIKINKRIPSHNSKRKNDTEIRLGYFCVNQRQNKKNNKLNEDRIKLFESINEWYWDLSCQFDDTYRNLKRWVEINNRLPNGGSDNEVEKVLSIFCVNQRQEKRKGKLSEDRINQLEMINGWYWDNKIIKMNELKQWIDTNQRLPREETGDTIERKLGRFASHQRTDKRKGKLNENDIKLLESNNEWYWDLHNSFNDNFNELKQWVKTNKRMPKHTNKDNIEHKIAKFCSRQRLNKKNNKLDDNKIKQFEGINGWYWT